MNDDLFGDIESFLKENPEKEQLLSDEEVQTVILSLAVARGDRGFVEDDAVKVVEWASNVRLEMSLLNLILKGLVHVDLDDKGEIVFGLTLEGKEVRESLNRPNK